MQQVLDGGRAGRIFQGTATLRASARLEGEGYVVPAAVTREIQRIRNLPDVSAADKMQMVQALLDIHEQAAVEAERQHTESQEPRRAAG